MANDATVIADASWCPRKEIATYAFYAASHQFTSFYEKGTIKYRILGNAMAEAVAILNGLYITCQWLHEPKKIVVQNDNGEALRLILSAKVNANNPLHSVLKKLPPLTLDLRFVNRKNGTPSARYVYDKVDNMAYRELAEARERGVNFIGTLPKFKEQLPRFNHRMLVDINTE